MSKNMVTLVDRMFPEIPDGIAVRPVLRSEDLLLIREAFLFRAKHEQVALGGVDIWARNTGRAAALLRRMLRKGGSKFYLSDQSNRRCK